MATLIERYTNRKGDIVLEIFKSGASYRFSGVGSLGAGCGRDLADLKERVFGTLSPRKRNNIVKVDI